MTTSEMSLTVAQEEAIFNLKKKWSNVTSPRPLVGDKSCAMVQVSSVTTGVSMVLGIESDGHVHS
mgnify:CR=1 FL=1